MPTLMTLRMRWPVCAFHDDRGAPGRAQGHVQHGAVLRDVDLLAPEHGVDPLTQAGLLRELEEQGEGLVGNAVLRVVEVNARGLRRQALATFGVGREQLFQVEILDLLIVPLEGLPGRARGQGEFASRHRAFPFLSSHSRNPPRNALALLPRRHLPGSSLTFLALPPPSTTSSGSRAAVTLATMSSTSRRHSFFPRFSRPRRPT